ncbi:MAG: hypothetical protein HRF49_03425 [bacterium]|jgi:hypothetical protein
MNGSSVLLQNFWLIIAVTWVIGCAAIWLLPRRAAVLKKLLGLGIAMFTTYLIALKIDVFRFMNNALNQLGLYIVGFLLVLIIYFALSVLSDAHAHDK